MIKRMIDFDDLMKCVNSLYTRCQSPNKGDYSLFMISKDPELSNIFMDCLDVLVREIKQLATPTPAYDEKTIYAILDILPKRLKDEKNDADFLSNKVNTFINGYNRAILIAISTITDLIGEATPAPKPPESIILNNLLQEMKDLYGRHNDKDLTRGLILDYIYCFIEQLEGEIKNYNYPPVIEKSIYDESGWCWDLSLIENDDEYHFLIESHRDGVGHKVTDKKSYYQRIGLTWFIQENLEENECLGDKIIAWRPLAVTKGE